MDVTTATYLAMSDDEYRDYINANGFDEPWPEIEEDDEFRDDRSQWTVGDEND